MSEGAFAQGHAELVGRLAAIRRRWFRAVALRTIGRGAAISAAAVLAGLGFDRVFAPHGAWLLILAAITALAAATGTVLVLRRMQPRPDDRHVARFVEERAAAAGHGAMDDALVSAVDVVEGPAERGGFSGLIVSGAVRRLRDVTPETVIPAETVRRSAWEAAAGIALVLVAALVSGPALARAIATARIQFFPGSIAVDVQPGNTRVAAGTPLRIHARLRNSRGRPIAVAPKLTVTADGDTRTVDMQPAADGFAFAFESVDRSFTYVVSAGAAKSSPYSVTALFGPRVRRIDIDYTYPPFTGLKPRTEEDGGDIYAPAGTRVRLRIRTDKTIARGELATSAGAVALQPSGDCMLEAELVLSKDDSYRLRLVDDDGLATSGDTEYFIRLMDDRPPDVRILRPSADQQITPLEEVAIQARADDDYGVAGFDLVYAVAGGQERVVPFDRVTGTDIEKVGTRLLAAEDLHVKPGDVISYYARARDVARGKRSTEATSDIFFLEVKPFNEEFVAAQSQAASGGAEADIESLIDAQKQVITSTWNIERRAGAGRSQDDIDAIAKAQAEVKARAEKMTRGSGRGRGRLPAPAPERVAAQFGRPQPQSGADPVGAAVAAMARAIGELEGQRTKEALQHEMTALNGLLQAQAEIKRRQVSQGASGSGNGGNRQGQDLTALFDKELQRQQRTNYETKSSVEQKPAETSKDDALERIRDLAKRQEDLSRRQRELAEAGLSTEEMKRQLEKLTREQMELRQQAEELARKQQSQQGSSSMQRASEQMRSAASDMRRDDAKGAAENGARAAEQLRRAEEQMAGGGSGTPKPAGELQMEAQQIAQEQRRIASEAERLEKTQGTAAEEARRRLADEKDRLAGRVEDLQRSAKQQAQSGAKNKDAAIGAAGKALERERVAERMRETASAMRKPQKQGQQGSGATEQELARAVEQAVGKLGGEASAESKQLSDELDRTREIRDRLNKIEQQMRQAEAAQQGSRGKDGRQGSRGTSGDGKDPGSLEKLQQDYQRELQRAKEALGRLAASEQRSGKEMSTPEQEQFSRSAPGTEAFKQDRSGWDSLRKQIDLSLERYEASVSARLAKKDQERLSTGGSDRVPETYRAWIARYYQSLATVKK